MPYTAHNTSTPPKNPGLLTSGFLPHPKGAFRFSISLFPKFQILVSFFPPFPRFCASTKEVPLFLTKPTESMECTVSSAVFWSFHYSTQILSNPPPQPPFFPHKPPPISPQRSHRPAPSTLNHPQPSIPSTASLDALRRLTVYNALHGPLYHIVIGHRDSFPSSDL